MQIRTDSLMAQHADKTMRLLQRADVKSEFGGQKLIAGNPFSDLLAGGMAKVNSMQLGAEEQMEQLLTGGEVNQAEVFTSVQKADMSFRLLVQIRNKLMSAYEELNAIRV